MIKKLEKDRKRTQSQEQTWIRDINIGSRVIKNTTKGFTWKLCLNTFNNLHEIDNFFGYTKFQIHKKK